MTLTEKEKLLLKDLKSSEKLCIEKYEKFASEAARPELKSVFEEIKQVEQGHLNTITGILDGNMPGSEGGSTFNPSAVEKVNYTEEERKKDKYLCEDALSTEKYVSSSYNTAVFEFAQAPLRNCLNHIQKEEQQHGEKIYNYMAANGMYN